MMLASNSNASTHKYKADRVLVDREIKTAGGEGGASVIERIRETLSEAVELITADRAMTQETLLSLSRLFFEPSQTPAVAHLREQFACHRRWPVLEEATLLESMILAGVAQGHRCLFRMGSAEDTRPAHCFSRESGRLPLDLDLNAAGWSLVSTQGARQRGWLGTTVVDRGHLVGEPLRRCLPVLRSILERVCDDTAVPDGLERYLTQQCLKLRLSLPLDEEASAKLA